MINRLIRYFLDNRLITAFMLAGFVVWGIATAPFGWQISALPSDPVPVDAIPDIGENQQIVFTTWPGRSPQDIEDQVSYPLTTYLLGIPGVRSVRSSSVFGFSAIYLIFREDVEFYWSRSRILEKLSTLPAGFLPDEVRPTLGPDATALGQVFWYTLEGRDEHGNTTGGWDLHELRAVQDFYVKYALNATEGVSEVASVGGFVKEYQIDVNPDALQAYHIPLHKVMLAVTQSNRDVGAKTIELNQAEYLVRGLGSVRSVKDLEEAVVAVEDNVPVRIKDIAVVTLGPAARRGLLDKGGAEVVGGVVVARYGSNPLAVINRVKEKIKEIAPGLPQKTLADGTVSRLTLVPFYDRSQLIRETLGTLEDALSLEILIVILVVMVMVYNLRASFLISCLLPIAVLMVFIAMRYLGITANVVALSGIAIAIGTMADLGIILSENILKHLSEAPKGEKLIATVYRGASEVGGAILTAVSTTVVSFIPIFTMQAAEGKLFGPLAFTKTFALIAALIVSLLILPTLAYWFFGARPGNKKLKRLICAGLILSGIVGMILGQVWGGTMLLLFGLIALFRVWYSRKEGARKGYYRLLDQAELVLTGAGVVWLLGKYWLPLGADRSLFANVLFVALSVGVILGAFRLLEYYYRAILRWCLAHKVTFLLLPVFLVFFGVIGWLGFDAVFGFAARGAEAAGMEIRTTKGWSALVHTFPEIGEEFMPSLDEGSFLLMPTSMPHSGMEYNRRVAGRLDMLLTNIPEVDLAVGKLGRAESALDPAPVSMFEHVINYKPEYMVDDNGRRVRFKVDNRGRFVLKDGSSVGNEEAIRQGVGRDLLVEASNGRYFRNWRKEIGSPDDIWDEITRVTRLPGVTSAPKLQPIETRLVMLQTGMRAPMGIKVYGPDLPTIQRFGLQLEKILKQVPSVKTEAVFADRVVGKPYLLLRIDRERIARYGLTVGAVQQVIETAIGGVTATVTVEGRERFPVRVRYPRELRDDPGALAKVLVPTPAGAQIPLGQVADIEYTKGPQAIKSEDTFLTGYVLFDKRSGLAEAGVVDDAQKAIRLRIDRGDLVVPPGVSFRFSGSYENQVRAEKRLAVIVPVVLVIVFLILYLQFRSVSTSLMVFSGITLAFSGGFIMIWLYGQEWFLNFSAFGIDFREVFQIQTINLSVAVWVGFIALFGIATDDGVLMATYLEQRFAANKVTGIEGIRRAVTEAGLRRVRPAVMTSATTIIALLPVLTSTGRGSDIMVPMAIPAFGGMAVAAVTYFVVPVLYCLKEERKFLRRREI